MCSDFKLLEKITLQSKIVQKWILSTSPDNRYCIMVDDGFYVVQVCGFMNSVLPTLSLKKLFVKMPAYVLSIHLGINLDSFVNELDQFDMYETILRLDVSAGLKGANPVKPVPVYSRWSPAGLIGNGDSAVGVLTNTGGLNIFVRTVNEVEIEEYISVVNISTHLVEYFSKSWSDFNRRPPPVKLLELKRRAEQVNPSVFTWSHLVTIENEKFCLLCVGHTNGGITIWRFKARIAKDATETGVIFMGFYNSEFKKITSLHWQPSSQNGLLIIGDMGGKVKAVSITDINLASVAFGDEINLWTQEDNIMVELLKVFVYNHLIYIFITKGSFLIICLINQNGKILDVHNFHAGNCQIVAMEHFTDNIFLVLTYTGTPKELKLLCENEKIRIEWRPIYIDIKWSLYRTYGLIISPNKVFFLIVVNSSKLVTNNKHTRQFVKILLFMNMGKDPLAVLMKNSTGSLKSYWDCLEILRLDGLVEKKLPCDGLPAGLDYDKLSLIQLKTCLWLSKSSETMYNKMHTIEDFNILHYNESKCIVKIKLAINHMRHLLELIGEGVDIGEFHMHSLDILNMYLKEIIADGTVVKLGLGVHTMEEMYDVISAANELVYPDLPRCLWCKEKIIGLSCIPAHTDNRCNISLMPVMGFPYYKCQFCECIVSSKLNEVYKVVFCPYCDIPLDWVSPVNKWNSKDSSITLQGVEYDCENLLSCNSDCVSETLNITNIENHAFTNIEKEGTNVNLIWISSSDEDSETEENMDITSEVTVQDNNAIKKK